jgi:hypothetical protein
MSCQLGFNNSHKAGGEYIGNNMGLTLGKVYLQLALDDNIDPNRAIPKINIDMVQYDKPPVQRKESFLPESPWLHELFGKDEYNQINQIYCTGFGTKEAGSCDQCPYYQT